MIRNPIPWPNGAKCPVAITFDVDVDSGLNFNFPDSADTRICAASKLRFEIEVGVPRLVDVFRRFGIRQTFFVPGWCLDRYPELAKTILDDGHEIAHHGYLHEKANVLSDEEEHRSVQRGIDAIVKATGQRPRGYRAPSYAFSKRTLRILAEEGISYDSSLMGAELPYLIKSDKSDAARLVELPVDTALDDWNQYVSLRDLGQMMPIASPARAFEVYRAEFDAAWKYGVPWISIWHPFATARLARCDAMIELIEYMQDKGQVWFATLEEIALYVETSIAAGWQPRIDTLPFYTSPIPELQSTPTQATA